MGLDISAYSHMVPVECDSAATYCEKQGHVRPYINPDFPKHAEEIRGCYRMTAKSKEHSFSAGLYSGYNWWRDELAELAEMSEDLDAFQELTFFSDCEGTIGPTISRKLAGDFKRYQSQADARRSDGTMFAEKYDYWRRAFELAGEGGFVRFR